MQLLLEQKVSNLVHFCTLKTGAKKRLLPWMIAHYTIAGLLNMLVAMLSMLVRVLLPVAVWMVPGRDSDI